MPDITWMHSSGAFIERRDVKHRPPWWRRFFLDEKPRERTLWFVSHNGHRLPVRSLDEAEHVLGVYVSDGLRALFEVQ